MRRVRSWFVLYLVALAVVLATAGPAIAQICYSIPGIGEMGTSCWDCPDATCSCSFWTIESSCSPWGICHQHWQITASPVEGFGCEAQIYNTMCVYLNWHCFPGGGSWWA